MAAGDGVATRGRATYLLGGKGGIFRRAARFLLLGEAEAVPSLIFKCTVFFLYILRFDLVIGVLGRLSLDGARQHFETRHGCIPGLIIVRMAPIRRPLGTFTSSFVDAATSYRQSEH